MFRKAIVHLLLLGVLINFLSGCEKIEGVKKTFSSEKICEICHFISPLDKEVAKKVSLSQRGLSAIKTEAPVPEGAIRVGIAAIVSPKKGFLYYKELLDYLAERLSKPVILKQGHYREINGLLRAGALDFAFVCSGPYIAAHKKFGAELLVVPVVKGKTAYHSYIIVHQSSEIHDFDGLKGRSFAFTDPLSTTGWMFPVFLLIKKGMYPETYFSKTVFTRSHDNSIVAVAKKLVDGAAVDSMIWDYLSETNPQLVSKTRIISISPPYGNPPVVVRKNLDVKTKKELEQVFLGLHKEERGRQILAKLRIDKFIKAPDSMYDSVRKMKADIEKAGY